MPRPKGTTATCALCPNVVNGEHVICEPCRRRHSPVSPFEGWVKSEVVFLGSVGSDSNHGMIVPIHSSDDFYETGYGKTQKGG